MQNRDDILAAITVAVLLLLTALGNATVMMAVSAIGCVAGLLVFRSFHGFTRPSKP
jgi:hypothetical protein